MRTRKTEFRDWAREQPRQAHLSLFRQACHLKVWRNPDRDTLKIRHELQAMELRALFKEMDPKTQRAAFMAIASNPSELGQLNQAQAASYVFDGWLDLISQLFQRSNLKNDAIGLFRELHYTELRLKTAPYGPATTTAIQDAGRDHKGAIPIASGDWPYQKVNLLIQGSRMFAQREIAESATTFPHVEAVQTLLSWDGRVAQSEKEFEDLCQMRANLAMALCRDYGERPGAIASPSLVIPKWSEDVEPSLRGEKLTDEQNSRIREQISRMQLGVITAVKKFNWNVYAVAPG